jgi:spermidine/putrescine transport system substrate-binding protein
MRNHDADVSAILEAARTGRISRRQAFKTLAALGIGGALLPALSRFAAADDAPMGPGGIPLARPDKPVTLPLWEDPIKSGLEPETGGTFTVFNYADYIDKALVDEFGKQHKVKTQITTFDSMDQCITRLATHAVRADVTNITPDRLAQAVAGKLIKPVNPDYVPNLKKDVWPSLHSPFYDQESRYTVPYTVYTTGIGWRNDKVKEDIPNLSNPWSIFWNAQAYKGYVGVLDDSREALVLAMLYRGNYDINTEDPAVIDKALEDLKALIPICNPKVNITEYQTLPEGTSWLHQSWSGDLLGGVFSYMPEGTDPSVLSYWAAPRGKGPIQNDCWAISATTKKPVLAHLWLNYIIDNTVATDNFLNFNGYQPPMNSITPDELVAQGRIPANLKTAVMTAEDFGPGALQEMTLTPKGQALWQSAYAKFVSGA